VKISILYNGLVWMSESYDNPQRFLDSLGALPDFLVFTDQRKASEQFAERYAFGGWRPFKGFKFDPQTKAIKYPGDPALKPIASVELRDELVLIYPYSWVGILQPDGSFEIARLD
jgi:hypothetical protein